MAGKRAAIYTRISDDKEGRELGVARQEDDCRALAAREGLAVVATYSDNDISASTISRKRRPDWLRMLGDAEAGRFDVILAYSSSRLTRRGREREDLLDLHDDHGTELHFVASGKPDLSTAAGRQVFMMLGTMDTAEPERTSELVRRKQRELAEAGRHNGPRPYGWNVIGKGADQRLEVNESEADVLLECVQRVLDGEGLWRIVNDLNARGLTTSKGKPWQTQVLRRVLLRDRNYGYRRHQPRDRAGRPKGRPELFPGQWSPIVDRETHDRVVAVLTDPARRSNNRGTAVKYLLTGIALCGECKRPLVGTAAFDYEVKGYKPKGATEAPVKVRHYPPSYKCPHAGCHKVQVRMAELDAFVEEVVAGVLERDGVRLLGGDAGAAEAARERIAQLEAKLAVAADQFADDLVTAEQLARITARLRPQLDQERAHLQAALPADGLAAYAGASGAEAWLSDDVERRRRVMRVIGLAPVVAHVGSGKGATPIDVRVTF